MRGEEQGNGQTWAVFKLANEGKKKKKKGTALSLCQGCRRNLRIHPRRKRGKRGEMRPPTFSENQRKGRLAALFHKLKKKKRKEESPLSVLVEEGKRRIMGPVRPSRLTMGEKKEAGTCKNS